MKPLRIGILADGGDAGGGRTHILTLCEHLPSDSFEIYFFSIGSGALSHSVEKMEPIKLTEYPLPRKFDPKILKNIRNWVNQNKIEIVHTHGLKANMYGRLALYRTNTPIITTYHSNPLFDYTSKVAGFIFSIIDQLTISRSNHYIAVSYEIATQLIKRGISQKKITIIKNGVNPFSMDVRISDRKRYRSQIRAELNIAENAIIIGSLGRLVKVKGYPEIIGIFAEYFHRSPQKPYLLIVGGGQEEKNLKNLVQQKNLTEYVRFVGFQKDPFPYLYAVDAMLFAPKAEALGISILESMNVGIPVIAKKVGGIRELIMDEYNGNIKSTKTDMVASLTDLFLTPDKQRAFAENGYSMIQQYFANQIMIEKTANVYKNIKKEKIQLLGVLIDNLTKSDAVKKSIDWLAGETCHQVSTLNIEMLNMSTQNVPLKLALEESDLVLPDGISIIKLGKQCNEYFSERIPGIEYSEALLSYANEHKLRVFFLGGKPETIEKLRISIPIKFPNLPESGFHHGYFSNEQDPDILQTINAFNPNILFVGMGMGRQESWIHEYKHRIPAKIAVGVGGSLDVWAGNTRRAPQIFIRFNLEWMYRMLLQPKERFKRILSTLPCLVKVLKENQAKHKTIVISGYYGYGNIGDEAILNTLLRDLKSIPTSKELHLSILSSNPYATSTTTDTFAIQRFDPLAVIRELKNMDGLISGGGGLIQDITSWKSPIYYLGIIALARFFRKKVLLYANGMGPLQYSLNRKLTRIVLNRVNHISVRDTDSQNLLSSLGVNHSKVRIDPIFSLKQTNVTDSYSQYQDFIAVSFGPNKDTLANLSKIAQFLDFISETTGKTCLFTPFYPGFDRLFSKSLQKNMKTKSVVIETFCPPEEMLTILKRCAFGVGMRLHFLIFLAILNKPMLPYLYDPKVKTFSEMLSLPFSLNQAKTLEEMKTIFTSFADTLTQETNFSEIVESLKDLNHLNLEDLSLFCQNL